MNTWYLLAIVPLAFWLWERRDRKLTQRSAPLYIRPRLRNASTKTHTK